MRSSPKSHSTAPKTNFKSSPHLDQDVRRFGITGYNLLCSICERVFGGMSLADGAEPHGIVAPCVHFPLEIWSIVGEKVCIPERELIATAENSSDTQSSNTSGTGDDMPCISGCFYSFLICQAYNSIKPLPTMESGFQASSSWSRTYEGA